MRPFDAVLFIAFGGPLGPADVRPFLENVLRGRRVSPGRVEEVAHHYDIFGGVSPLTPLTQAQARGLEARLAARGLGLPVYVGMRNWHPFLADTLRQMAGDGVRRAVGFIAAAHRSYSSCTQYRENVRAARAAIEGPRGAGVEVTYVGDWHVHPAFIDACADRADVALRDLPAGLASRARLVFTAHSIPAPMAARYPYAAQFEATAAATAARLRERTGLPLEHACAYQSRSGRPEDPWLGPDICDYLRGARRDGVEAVVVCPVGFLCDHIEVLYDLDTEAATVARELGLPMARAKTVNDHPQFLEAIADAVERTVSRYARGRPLPIVADPASASAPALP